MKNSCFCLIVCVLLTLGSFGQVNQWIWMHGSNVSGDPGNNGILGIPSPNNNPPSLYEAVQWTDTNGNFWLYAGINQGYGHGNDLWMYKTSTNEWTWMNGTDSPGDTGNYGIQGIPSPNNRPPGFGYGAATWTDLSNNLWFFGGSNASQFADLWKYDIAHNEWTWIKGPGTAFPNGVYGTIGVPDTANYPCGRSETAAAWTDDSGNFWLFGGEGMLGTMNDLWRFNIAANTWTWMKGSNAVFQYGYYGTKGVEVPRNTPGGRMIYSNWKDKNGDFWIFGGSDGIGGQFNDVWRYKLSTNNWTWMGGSNYISSLGNWETPCLNSPDVLPGTRYENRAYWSDTNGDFWTFGGGFTSHFDSTWNDLWKYCVETNRWVFVNGDTSANPVGSWGLRGVSSPSNKPNGRAGAIGWTDNKGHLYLFGGSSSFFPTFYNDMWKYTIDSSCGICGLPRALFQTNDTVLCENDCINFTNLCTYATSWQWTFQGGSPSSSSDANPQFICYLKAGKYDVKLLASNSNGNDSLTITKYINVAAAPPTPVITLSNDTLYCSIDSSYTSYQWYADSTLLAGKTDSLLVITHGGNYNVKVTNGNDCSISVGIILGLPPLTGYGLQYSIQPNPSQDELILTCNTGQGTTNAIVTIYTMLGQIRQQEKITFRDRNIINVKNLASGIYFVQVAGEKSKWIGPFVKE